MVAWRESMVVRGRRAAHFVLELVDVAHEVAAWRREREAFVEMHKVEEHRRGRRSLRGRLLS
jgi:hypothetical protein